MINVASQVRNNEISYEGAINILMTAFNLSKEQAIKILGN